MYFPIRLCVYVCVITLSKTTGIIMKINHLISNYDITIKSHGQGLISKEHIATHTILLSY